MLKGKLVSLNLTLKKKVVKKLTEDASESISQEDWASCRHVKDVEKRFYATDIAVDDQVDRLVITVTSSNEDTDTASDCDVVQLMTKGQTQRVGDMKRLEISLL